MNRLLENPQLSREYQILCVPGGFSYGDDVAAGRILGNLFQHHLNDAMREFKAAGKLVLGICNGFQVLIKSGVLLADDEQGAPATLCLNDSGRYEDRWVQLAAEGDKCVFLRGVDKLELPVAHAEGKFVARNETELSPLAGAGQLVLRYVSPTGSAGRTVSREPQRFAGQCGRHLRRNRPRHGPDAAPGTEHRSDASSPVDAAGNTAPGEGLRLFQNAVEYFAA